MVNGWTGSARWRPGSTITTPTTRRTAGSSAAPREDTAPNTGRRLYPPVTPLVGREQERADLARLLADPGIVRNRLKIAAAVRNARAFLDLLDTQRNDLGATTWPELQQAAEHFANRQIPIGRFVVTGRVFGNGGPDLTTRPAARNVDDVMAITHAYGCGVAINAPGAAVPIRTLQNLALNPNFGGEILVVGSQSILGTADASDLPWPDDSFDLVVQLNMPFFFGEIARVLRPGGHVVAAASWGEETPFFLPRSVWSCSRLSVASSAVC